MNYLYLYFNFDCLIKKTVSLKSIDYFVNFNFNSSATNKFGYSKITNFTINFITMLFKDHN